jgi:ComF family protein
MLKDLLSLVFPSVCAACGRSLYSSEDCVCTICHYKLPQTDFHKQPDNPVAKLFWGRVPLQGAASYYSFSKGGKVQKLVHQLKYRGKKEIGVTLGRFYGSELRQSAAFADVHTIVPVPLFADKLKKRGYNQSESFAQGLARSMDLPLDTRSLQRIRPSETQTKRTRFERWKNVENIFSVLNEEKLQGRHILLADDVVTTGATLEACAQALLKLPDTRVSIATIAFAAI